MNTLNTLWMGDIEPWMDELFITKAFLKNGFKPKEVKLIIDKRINKFYNFCLVTFNSLEEANLALFRLNGKKISKTNMYFKLNIIKSTEEKSKNVYVGNLSPKVNDIELYNFFKSKYSSVYYASVINEKGISKGYGFVHFSKEKEYINCLKEMNGTVFHNKIIKVKPKTYTDKEMKKTINLINNLFSIHNYYKNLMYQTTRIEEEIYIENDETTFSSQEKEQEQEQEKGSPLSNFNLKPNKFSDNIELLESNDHITLYKKIKESVNKMVDSYKSCQKYEGIPPIILYYSSNYKRYIESNEDS